MELHTIEELINSYLEMCRHQGKMAKNILLGPSVKDD